MLFSGKDEDVPCKRGESPFECAIERGECPPQVTGRPVEHRPVEDVFRATLLNPHALVEIEAEGVLP